MNSKLDLGILVSGNGTNLQAILDAIGAERLSAQVRLVLSDNSQARAVARAHQSNVPVRVIPRVSFRDRRSFEAAMIEALRGCDVQWVVLAGFMRVLTRAFLSAFPMRIINIHPSLLPAFPGLDGPGQALAQAVRITGCTVHFVDEGVDTGPIIAQAAVPLLEGDTHDSLSERIRAREHQLLVSVLRWISEGRVTIRTGPPGASPRVTVHGQETWFGLRG